MRLELYRVYGKKATHGALYCEGRLFCFTLELPYVSNQRSISCIPEGVYQLQKRFSSRFKEHIELLKVPDRSFILFHPANNAQRDLKGCIAPVSELLSEGWGAKSKVAMEALTRLVYAGLSISTVEIEISEATDISMINKIKKGKL
ncbi:MAG: DUF5675 family protein [Flavobacteriaceae bacterium]|jgi:hypothetical protein|nr:DUF5675 family protein [Flavobacteriaceae bacterium]